VRAPDDSQRPHAAILKKRISSSDNSNPLNA
jgi:hypothetical protein